MIKHNCCKECSFEWKEVYVDKDYEDVIICKICGRIFKEKDKNDKTK